MRASPTITCESLTADIVRRVADTQGPSFDGVVAVADDQRRLSGMRERLSAVEVHPFMQWEMETAGPNDRLASTMVLEIAHRPRRLVPRYLHRKALGERNSYPICVIVRRPRLLQEY